MKKVYSVGDLLVLLRMGLACETDVFIKRLTGKFKQDFGTAFRKRKFGRVCTYENMICLFKIQYSANHFFNKKGMTRKSSPG